MYGSRLTWLYGYPGFWPRVMADFLAGVVFYVYRDRIVLSWPWLIAATLGLLAFGVALPTLKFLPLAVPVLGAYVLFFVAYSPLGRLQHFASRGDFSYGLYLYAFPIQQLLIKAFRPYLHPLTPDGLGGRTLAAAVLSWRLVEGPCLHTQESSRSPEMRPELSAERVAKPESSLKTESPASATTTADLCLDQRG